MFVCFGATCFIDNESHREGREEDSVFPLRYHLHETLDLLDTSKEILGSQYRNIVLTKQPILTISPAVDVYGDFKLLQVLFFIRKLFLFI